jgi:hypothetical protein
MTALPHQGERRCADCGCVLRSGHQGRCECCERAHLAYRPEHDPGFGTRLLTVLRANRGRPVNVYRALGIRHCGLSGWRCVQNHIERFRRHGHVIVGRHDGTYEYVRQMTRGRLRGSARASRSAEASR